MGISPEGEQQMDVPKDMSRIGVDSTRSLSDDFPYYGDYLTKSSYGIISWNHLIISFYNIKALEYYRRLVI